LRAGLRQAPQATFEPEELASPVTRLLQPVGVDEPQGVFVGVGEDGLQEGVVVRHGDLWSSGLGTSYGPRAGIASGDAPRCPVPPAAAGSACGRRDCRSQSRGVKWASGRENAMSGERLDRLFWRGAVPCNCPLATTVAGLLWAVSGGPWYAIPAGFLGGAALGVGLGLRTSPATIQRMVEHLLTAKPSPP